MISQIFAIAAAKTAAINYVINGLIQYNVPSNAIRSSAGVYSAADDTLVRTLWGNKTEIPSTSPTFQWDGLNDNGVDISHLKNTIKLKYNSITAEVEGFVGNTSSSQSDGTTFRSYAGITSLASTPDKMYFGYFFWEHGINSKYYNLSDITKCYDVSVGVGAIILDCVTDGNIVLWLCADQYKTGGIDRGQTNYIFGSNVSDNSPVSFVGQSSHDTGAGPVYDHLIGWFLDTNDIAYLGIAIHAKFIYATIPSKNQVYVYNRVDGSTRYLTYTSPTKLRSNGNTLWMVVNGVVRKYTINPDTGDLTDTTISLLVTNPNSIAISYDNSTVIVTDVATHQVKGFNTSDGNQLWTLGQFGGYDSNGPSVTNDKFMFNRVDLATPTVCYQSDGSFWVNDIGNYRIMHFNADRTFKERIMYCPSSRSINIDPGTGNYFLNELEFAIDTTKPLDNGVNGSWTLINNWKVNTSLDIFAKFIFVITLDNGHKYAGSGSRIYDLLPTGAVDVCGYPITDSNMEYDGSFWQKLNYNNQYFEIRKALKTGYIILPSGAQIPLWGPTQLIATTPTITADSCLFYGYNMAGSTTNNRRVFFYNPNQGALGFNRVDYGYHLGSIKIGDNKFDWQSARGTYDEYRGDFPRDGSMDTSQFSGHSENCRVIVDNEFLIWGINGEFYQAYINDGGGEINIHNLVYEDGLPLITFGKTGMDTKISGTVGFAGNSFKTALKRTGNIIRYIHCDESAHGAITCWIIKGLDTVSEQLIPITVTNPIVITPDPSGLMNSIPFRSLFYGDSKWTATPDAGRGDPDSPSPEWRVRTSLFSADPHDIDLSLFVRSDSGEYKVERVLENIDTNNWSISSKLYLPGLIYNGEPFHIDLFDNSGKTILSTKFGATPAYNGLPTINDMNIITESQSRYSFQQFQPFIISNVNGVISVTYSIGVVNSFTRPYDPGANFNKPSKLSFRIFGSGNGQSALISFKELKLLKGALTSVIPTPITNLILIGQQDATSGNDNFPYGSAGGSTLRAGKYKWHFGQGRGLITYLNNRGTGVTYRFVFKDVEVTNGTGFMQFSNDSYHYFDSSNIVNGDISIDFVPTNFNDPAILYGSDNGGSFYTSGYRIYVIR